MSAKKSIKIAIHCNSCGGITNHKLLKALDRPWRQRINERFEVSGSTNYRFLQCLGCEDAKLEISSWFSEVTDENDDPIITKTNYPPNISRPKPKWFNMLDHEWHITKLLEESYSATYNNAPSLTSMGLRAIIEAVMIDKIGDKGTFANNLQEFVAKGFISPIQKESLKSALEIGHASIHRGHIPSEYQLEAAFDITESLVNELYLVPQKAKAAKRELPARKT